MDALTNTPDYKGMKYEKLLSSELGHDGHQLLPVVLIIKLVFINILLKFIPRI